MLTLHTSLALGDREIVAFVGAGGKTSAMFRLARELRATGATVVVTTTTKILVPPASDDLYVVTDQDEHGLLSAVAAILERGSLPVVARARTSEGKLAGIPLEWVAGLANLRGVGHVLVEADGAAGKPFKAPREGEPVIPPSTTIVVPVVGIDALGEPIAAVSHRPEQVAALTGLAVEDRLDTRAIARVLLDPRGSAKGAPPGARVVPLVNKADTPSRIASARLLADELRRSGAERVVIAALESDPAVIEIVTGTTRSTLGGAASRG